MFGQIGRWFRAIGWLGLLVACVGSEAAILVAAGTGPDGAPVQSADANWVLTWSDEFDGPDGSAPDLKKWTEETGGSGWGNNGTGYYTARRNSSPGAKGQFVIDSV